MELKELLPIAIAFVVVAIFLSIGLDVMNEVQSSTREVVTTNIYNETAYINGTTYYFGGGNASTDAGTYTIIYAINNNSISIKAANWTLDSTRGSIRNASTNTYFYNYANISYSFTSSVTGYAYNSTRQGLVGGTKIVSWLPTIGIVLGAAVVIGILISYFGVAGESFRRD
jgi:hypothetical protein